MIDENFVSFYKQRFPGPRAICGKPLKEWKKALKCCCGYLPDGGLVLMKFPANAVDVVDEICKYRFAEWNLDNDKQFYGVVR